MCKKFLIFFVLNTFFAFIVNILNGFKIRLRIYFLNKYSSFLIGNVIIIAIFLIYFVVTLISQQKTLNQYKSEASTYSEQLETAKETNSELQKTKENVNSTEYIEEVAREKLDMYLPNERVYIDISK